MDGAFSTPHNTVGRKTSHKPLRADYADTFLADFQKVACPVHEVNMLQRRESVFEILRFSEKIVISQHNVCGLIES